MTVFLLIYWIIMILWFFGYSYVFRADPSALGAGLMQWILFLLIGIKVFPIPLG